MYAAAVRDVFVFDHEARSVGENSKIPAILDGSNG